MSLLTPSRPARQHAQPNVSPPVGNTLADDHICSDAQACRVVSNPLPGDHLADDSQSPVVAGNNLPDGQCLPDDQSPSVDALRLGIAAALLDDLEDLRKRTANRLRAAEGFGLPADAYADHLAAIKQMEHRAILDLQRAMRKHPLGPWVTRTVGIGEKQGARLIAAIGDPAWNTAEDRPRRGPAELWAYCGYAPEQKRTKGVKSNWNADAKMRAHLCAKSCIKQMHSPYRADYDGARASWADRDTSDMHKHNHALRVVAKAILRDLWKEATS